MIPCTTEDAFCGDASEGAALGLLGLMTGISEEFWCAGWLTGLEFSLWKAPTGMRFGQGSITERQSQLLKLLSEESDGWWCWQNGEATFVCMADWLKLLPDDSSAGSGARDNREERATR